jgi:anthranilate phosphoribosyltransferase
MMKNHLSTILRKLSNREDLTVDEAELAAGRILDNLSNNKLGTLALMVGFFGGLTIKGPTIEELIGMAAAMEAAETLCRR